MKSSLMPGRNLHNLTDTTGRATAGGWAREGRGEGDTEGRVDREPQDAMRFTREIGRTCNRSLPRWKGGACTEGRMSIPSRGPGLARRVFGGRWDRAPSCRIETGPAQVLLPAGDRRSRRSRGARPAPSPYRSRKSRASIVVGYPGSHIQKMLAGHPAVKLPNTGSIRCRRASGPPPSPGECQGFRSY